MINSPHGRCHEPKALLGLDLAHLRHATGGEDEGALRESDQALTADEPKVEAEALLPALAIANWA